LGLLAGTALTALTPLLGAAQPTEPNPKSDQSPRPPTELGRPVRALKYQIPNKDRAIFQGFRDAKTGKRTGGIIDFVPIANETENSQEFDAWHEILAHVGQFTAAELEEHAGRDATRDELVGPDRLLSLYRLELLRFDGKITKVRRLPATPALQKGDKPVEVFEAFLAPLDEPPTEPVSIVFTEWPEALAAMKPMMEARWVEVDRWGTAAGFFFKALRDAPGAVAIPVLIGKSVRILNEPPAPPDQKKPAALDKTLRVFQFIRNNAPVATGDENWEEMVAWNRVLLHARRFSAEELEREARADLSFFDLYNDGKWVDRDGRARYDGRRDYTLDLIRFEGRLLSLRKMTPSRDLRDVGVETAYEGWLVPKDEPSANPVCIVFTDPLEGVEAIGRVNKWVSFAGYVFKLMQYESGEHDTADPSKYKWKRAPLLLGRAAIVRTDPENASSVSWQSFITVATAVVFVLLGTALGLNWWFRRGDRSARREIEANRARNPFGEPAS